MDAPTSESSSAAFVAANGELAWRREDAERAIIEIRDSGHSIPGGEVWLITGPRSWSGLIPRRGGGPPSVWHWETSPRLSSEPWQVYCHRTAAESIRAICAMSVEQETPAEFHEQLRFNVTHIAEPEA